MQVEVFNRSFPPNCLIIKHKGMDFKFIMGTDMSKEWFHYCLMSPTFDIVDEGEVINKDDAIFIFISKLIKAGVIDQMSDVILVLEHTGIYVQNLVRAWLSKGGRVSLVHANKVSEHLGGQEGWDEKTDQLDARRLAEYGIRYTDKLKLHQPKSNTIIKLQAMQRQRSRLINAIKLLEVPAKESEGFDSLDLVRTINANQVNSLKALKTDLKNIEFKLKETIEEDPELKQLFQLITSVDGVGAVTAREFIIATGGFTTFMPDQAKAFARYAGVVPKRKESGKFKRKARIRKRGNKKIKTLLTLGATSLIHSKSELAVYYQRKIEEGKAHFCVINAMRNKMILRIFAVVRNQVMYEKNLNLNIN